MRRKYVSYSPDECIDCECVPECPVEAIFSDNEDGAEKWVEINQIC